MKTVHELRKTGYQVNVIHDREDCRYSIHLTKSIDGYPEHRQIIQGTTTVNIVPPGPVGQVVFGTAYCRLDDQFSRKQGLRIALGRALKYMGMESK